MRLDDTRDDDYAQSYDVHAENNTNNKYNFVDCSYRQKFDLHASCKSWDLEGAYDEVSQPHLYSSSLAACR